MTRTRKAILITLTALGLAAGTAGGAMAATTHTTPHTYYYGAEHNTYYYG